MSPDNPADIPPAQASAPASAEASAEASAQASISQALSLPDGAPVALRGLVAVAGKTDDSGTVWLTITDTTDQIYALGPPFSGKATVVGTIRRPEDKPAHLEIERIRRAKRAFPVMPVAIAALAILIPAILYFGVILSIPDFHIADYIGPTEPPAGLSDLKRDTLSRYRLESLWHEGPVLCAELRNTGQMVIPHEDLDRISFSIDGVGIFWNRTTLPDKLMLGKRLFLCTCPEYGVGCPDGRILYKYIQVNGAYPTVAIEIKPWFGTVETSSAIRR